MPRPDSGIAAARYPSGDGASRVPERTAVFNAPTAGFIARGRRRRAGQMPSEEL
ncbi:hypothetical protein GCM10010177_79370 [Actinomadura citrea]|nr:hypothetical protein GCM10010177_79370 [Actinomadura citrea]